MNYPTRNGISVPLHEIRLPRSEHEGSEKHRTNHHNEWTLRQMGRHTITLALRNLERHQYVIQVDTHKEIHKRFDPPELPTLDQAAKEILDAYEKGENFKVWNDDYKRFDIKPISEEDADKLARDYPLVRIFNMAAD